MTQQGTSVVIKQTNDGLGPVELRLWEKLQDVAKDQEEAAETSSAHLFCEQSSSVGVAGAQKRQENIQHPQQ